MNKTRLRTILAPKIESNQSIIFVNEMRIFEETNNRTKHCIKNNEGKYIFSAGSIEIIVCTQTAVP
jgi:hypothetical protein